MAQPDQGGIEEVDWCYRPVQGRIRLVRQLDHTGLQFDSYKIEPGQSGTKKLYKYKTVREVEVSDESAAYKALRQKFGFEDERQEDGWFHCDSESKVIKEFEEVLESFKND